MEIEIIGIDAVYPDPANVRLHDEKNLDAIRASLNRFGQQKPIVVDRRGEVVAGNGTLEAAKSLGWPEIRVIKTNLGRAEATAYAIADNRTGELATWGDDLAAQLDAIRDEDPELFEAIGFSDEELDELTAADTEAAGHEDHQGDDELPERAPAVTKPGEVVTIGEHRLICGDCVEAMAGLEENSIDAICTDPPYGIGFMGKGWDCSVPGSDFAEQAFRVLKPGGHIVAFGGTRTIHRLTVALEDAGFEVRDQIGWLQWQGFPKSLDISKSLDDAAGAVRDVVGRQKMTGTARRTTEGGSHGAARTNAADNAERRPTTIDITTPTTPDAKQWSGWGTALKPSTEPAILCRKPLDGTVAENVTRWGVGGLNIDGCRIEYGDQAWPGPGDKPAWEVGTVRSNPGHKLTRGEVTTPPSEIGRWPANIYACPKPARGEREAGCDGLAKVKATDVTGRKPGSAGQGHARSGMNRQGDIGNHHPTVKPTRLMRWLIRLITPPGAVVLDPFLGSGTTMLAAEREGLRCVGVEREPDYCDIARARVGAVVDA